MIFESGEGFDDLKSAKLEEIVTITFTEAASLEMKERIFSFMRKIIEFDNLPKTDKDYESIYISLKNLDDNQKSYVINRVKEAIK